MKKSSLFISAVLTTFMLAVLAGVVTASRSSTGTDPQVTVPQSAPVVVATASGTILPQEAAQIAARFTGHNDLFSVELVSFSGTSAYMVTFSSGSEVVVSQQGQVLNFVAVPTTGSRLNAQSLVPTYSETEHKDDDHKGDD